MVKIEKVKWQGAGENKLIYEGEIGKETKEGLNQWKNKEKED